jgi:hypothetical protein
MNGPDRRNEMKPKHSSQPGRIKRSTISWLFLVIDGAKRRMGSRLEERRVMRRVWSFQEGKVDIIFYPGVGEVETLPGIRYMINRLILPEYISMQSWNDAPEDWKSHNLILVGGPRANPITQEVLEAIGEQSEFTLDTERLLWEGKVYAPEKEEGKVQKDYGVIVKAQSPFKEGRLIFVIAGCHSLGTSAGAALISTIELGRQIAKLYDKGSFQILFQTKAFNAEAMSKTIEIILPTEFSGHKFLNPGLPISYDAIPAVRQEIFLLRPFVPFFVLGAILSILFLFAAQTFENPFYRVTLMSISIGFLLLFGYYCLLLSGKE